MSDAALWRQIQPNRNRGPRHLSALDSHFERYHSLFFFQAEDGIRDTSVTGVQTCALPIYRSISPWQISPDRWRTSPRFAKGAPAGFLLHPCQENRPELKRPFGERRGPHPIRSEERRVGKECRYVWSPSQ